jgi:S-adenosylmethionine:tRNA ribosyltransferase-isomerase
VKLSDFDFELPPELIAQEPCQVRGESRLLVVERDGGLANKTFGDVVDLLEPGTLLVVNETRVVPARFFGKRASGGKVEILLVDPTALSAEPGTVAIVRCGGTLRPPDEVVELEGGQARLQLLEALGGGRYRVAFLGASDGRESALMAAERCGRIPLPPYITRDPTAADLERYQTVFARVPGAIAAPTAALHFTDDLLARLAAKGVERTPVVLHVGPGTFLPIRSDDVNAHAMESERYEVPEATREALTKARAEGRPIVACGTTAVRALEGFAQSGEPKGATELFIRPGYTFTYVDGLITNFHLPKSTLLLLVSALAGVDTIRAAYAAAVAERYRFYSYGDAMLIAPSRLTQ